MAITKKYKQKIDQLILLNRFEISKKELIDFLGVAPNWISRNEEELKQLGFNLKRFTDINSKINKLLQNPTDLKTFNFLLLKYYINKAYVSFGLVAPFQIESKEIQDNEQSSFLLDSLDQMLIDTSFNYFLLLKDIIECEDLLNPLHSINFPSNVFLYLKTLFDSLHLLQDNQFDPKLELIVTNTFKDLFNLVPSEEQKQVVIKAINFASSSTSKNKSVSIQADAGSSKSICALVIQNILRVNLNPLIVAKTNKAIANMDNAKTIAKFLYENVGLSVTKDSWEERRLKAFQKENTIDFVIVDESSQVGELERLILSTVCKKILYIGDIQQCKPIHDRQAINTQYLHSLKNQYRFLNSTMKIEDSCFQVKFTEYHKEKRRDKLISLFNQSVIGTFTTIGYYEKEDNKYVLKNDFSLSFDQYKETLDKYSTDDSVVIAFSQNAVDSINYILNDGLFFKIGSKVSLKINDYDNFQYNGYQYRIIKILENNEYLCKSIESGNEYVFSRSWLTLSYAITTMSSQGSQWKYVLGIDKTGPLTELWTDRYVITTRASISVSFLSSEGLSNSNIKLQSLKTPKDILDKFIHNAKEGNRNNLLYSAVMELNEIDAPSVFYDKLNQLALKTGLPSSEIDSVFSHKIELSDKLILNNLSFNPSIRESKYFTPVFADGKTLKGSERTLTKEKALGFQHVKYIAEELKNSNRVVIDCDSKETVEKFKKYLNKTEAYINEDCSSAHFVFNTDKIIPTKHKHKIDLLGNEKFSLRNIKQNKTYNNLDTIELTQEILDIFNEL